jgi:cytochrome c oxidase cbb3-type subunit 1
MRESAQVRPYCKAFHLPMSESVSPNPASDRRLGLERAEPAEVDRAICLPVLVFFGSALFWLVVASGLWLLATVQSYAPHGWWSIPGVPWLTFGRVYPAFLNAFVYGWASLAGVGIGIWILARFGTAPIQGGALALWAGILWNIGVATGLIGILGGGGTGRELLEISPAAAFSILLALVIIAVWAIMIFWSRRTAVTFVSQWYLLGAFLWFPWSYLTANVLLNVLKIPGPAQPAIHWWYVNSAVGLWLTPIGLAAGYYFIAKIVNRPIHSYWLALLGFWGLAVFAGWTGMANVVGGPLPAWMITASIVANVLMIIPVIAVAANFHLTIRRDFEVLSWNLALRFIVVGAMIYTFAGIWSGLNSLRDISRVTEFTLANSARTPLTLYGFFSMVAFGAFYYIVPRLLGRNWLSLGLVKTHFWLSVVGLGLLCFELTVGGIIQGFGLLDPKIPFDAIGDLVKPFLFMQIVAVALLAVANFAATGCFATIFLSPTGGSRKAVFEEASLDASREVPVA